MKSTWSKENIELEESQRENADFKKFLAGQEVNAANQKESKLLKKSGKDDKESAF